VSIRLVPGQDPLSIASAFERLLRDAAPAGADLEIEVASSGSPALIDPTGPAIQLALGAVERVTGVRPLLVRWGASLPVISALADRGIPTVLTGFALPDCRMHAPNERMPLSSIEMGIAAAIEILRAWADCARPAPS
jgi:acetylornithine deacetylase/succinyl-diaminopimelate desuccinylase-like protein